MLFWPVICQNNWSFFVKKRSTTNLTTISKINERLVLQRLRRQLEALPNFSSRRSVLTYAKGRSTETALVEAMDDILGRIDAVLVK